MTANICSNIIHINYYGTLEENEIVSKEIYEILKNKFDVYFDEYDEDGLISDYQFDSEWTAPISFLDELSLKYNIDIRGVAYEFEDGYVEAYEILADFEEDITTPILKTVVSDDIKEGVDTIVLPENELDILNNPEDDVIVTDKELFEWKENKVLEDWQERVIIEKNELSEKILKLKTFLRTQTISPKSEVQLNKQLDAMKEYLSILNDRISLF